MISAHIVEDSLRCALSLRAAVKYSATESEENADVGGDGEAGDRSVGLVGLSSRGSGGLWLNFDTEIWWC
jgi:hypothetical protein